MDSLDEVRTRVQRKLDKVKGVKMKTHNRMFLLDVSSSMIADDKIFYAHQALKNNVKNGDGIVVFGEEIYYVDIKNIDTIMPFGMTAMLPAIKKALEFKVSNIILITDGEPNKDGYVGNIIDFVSNLSGIKIDTIGIGNDCDLHFLQTLSEMTNGKTDFVNSPEKLNGALKLLCTPSIQLN